MKQSDNKKDVLILKFMEGILTLRRSFYFLKIEPYNSRQIKKSKPLLKILLGEI